MQILSIHLKNIKSHRDTELTFSPGINVLSGPNGAGKSTIFEAIGYALFGVDAQSFVGNVERFLTIGAKRGEVAVVFQPAPDETYRVTRTVGTPSKWLLARETGGAFEVEEHKDARETEARLRVLLGLDSGRSLAEQFELVIGPFQNEFLGPFVIRQAAKRRDKFDEILGIDTWRKTFSETNSLLKAIKAKVEALESGIGPLRDQVAALPEKREEHRAAGEELKRTQEELELRQRDLAEVETLLLEMDRRELSLKALAVEIETVKGRIDNGKEKIGTQKELIDTAEKARQILSGTAAGKAAYEQTEAQLVALREKAKVLRLLEKETADLDKQAGTLKERFEAESRAIELVRQELLGDERALGENRKALTVHETVQQLAARLPEIRASRDDLRRQLGQFEGRRAGLQEGSEKLAEGICPFIQERCLNIAERPPQDVFSGKFAELDAERQRLGARVAELEQEEVAASTASDQLKALEIRQRELEQQAARLAARRAANEERAEGLKGLQKEQAAVQQQLALKQQALKEHGRLDDEIEAAEREKQKHQEARDLYLANQKQAADLEQRKADLRKYEQLLEQLQGERAEKEAALTRAGTEHDAPRHAALRARKDELGQGVGALGQKVEGLAADVVRLAGEIRKLTLIEGEITEKQAQVRAYGEKDELVKFLRNRVFKQVSGYLSERFREEISLRADRIYRTIAETDEELTWGDSYQIILRDMADGAVRERSDDQLSGGQTMSAVVALRLALLQTIGARVAFFDEPTSNLDAARRENLAHAFRAIDVGREEVTEHWYDQLFLVSHDVAFTEITDQLIQVGG